MSNELNNITIERFIDPKKIIKDYLVVVLFVVLFLLSGYIENNLFLPHNGLGLLQHINIWIFILINLLIPIAICLNYKRLKENLNDKTLKNLKYIFKRIAACKPIMFLWSFSRVCGFCFFVGNSLQNAHIINPLPFDYWDSINYIVSYFVSRLYKLYLFAYFIPISMVYVSILIISVSKLLVIRNRELTVYPIKNYMQSNALCNFSLNIMLTIVTPVICFSSGVYFIHKRFDITTIATIIICVLCTFMLLGAYLLLVNKFHLSIIKYKIIHIERLDSELSEINKSILNFQISSESGGVLDAYLKKEKYLQETRERINKISRFPLIIKAIFTSLTPCVPTIMKIIFSALKNFF